MTFAALIFWLLVAAVALWVLGKVPGLDATMVQFIRVVVIAIAALYTIYFLYVLFVGGAPGLPRPHR